MQGENMKEICQFL